MGLQQATRTLALRILTAKAMDVVSRTLRSPASVPRRRRGVLAAALLFKAASGDGFLKHRARQVQQLEDMKGLAP